MLMSFSCSLAVKAFLSEAKEDFNHKWEKPLQV